MPGRKAVTNGAWPASTPMSPSVPGRSTCATSPPNRSFSGDTRSKRKLAMGRLRSRRLGGELLALLDRLLDGADHVEGGLRQVIVLTLAQALEAADGVGKLDEHAGRAGEDFGDMERLRQEALDLAGARDR